MSGSPTGSSEIVRLFPLPNVVLFPHVELPLHVFERRYRELVRDALSDDRMIGMALLRGNWRRDYEGRPELFRLGCVGAIENFAALPDGRSNLILRGISRFEIVEEIEDGATLYRRARVRWLGDVAGDVEDLTPGIRARVDRLLERRGTARPPDLWERLPREGEKLVNALAFALDLPVVEKLALLECDQIRARAERLVQLIEFQLAAPLTGSPQGADDRAH
jgi:Lon protease-like protein